jgi:hypothetical protein
MALPDLKIKQQAFSLELIYCFAQDDHPVRFLALDRLIFKLGYMLTFGL